MHLSTEISPNHKMNQDLNNTTIHYLIYHNFIVSQNILHQQELEEKKNIQTILQTHLKNQ